MSVLQSRAALRRLVGITTLTAALTLGGASVVWASAPSRLARAKATVAAAQGPSSQSPTAGRVLGGFTSQHWPVVGDSRDEATAMFDGVQTGLLETAAQARECSDALARRSSRLAA